jgi:hypothetical protein
MLEVLGTLGTGERSNERANTCVEVRRLLPSHATTRSRVQDLFTPSENPGSDTTSRSLVRISDSRRLPIRSTFWILVVAATTIATE